MGGVLRDIQKAPWDRENELRLAQMQAAAAGSLLLDVQRDCISAVTALRKIAELRYAEDTNEPFDEALNIADAAIAAQGSQESA